MSEDVRRHYELYPYPAYPLLASVRRCDTYALNLAALWCRFNGEYPPPSEQRILVAGAGSFAPYPFGVANPGASITALDLSAASLRRARLHCLLHGVTNVRFVPGDLCDRSVAPGPFALVDAYGVLHHLKDPLEGLRALASRLEEGGVLRVMVYSRYARREEESIRRSLRMLRVTKPEQVLRMVRRSKRDSRLRRFFDASEEVASRAGLADALLHPCVTTFRIDGFMELVSASGLDPLLFAHKDAVADVNQELARIRRLEREGSSPGNFVLYLGRKTMGPSPAGTGTYIINPCLAKAVTAWKLGMLRIAGRLGRAIPASDSAALRFLRRFTVPVQASDLSPRELAVAERYAEELLLLRCRGHLNEG